MTKRFVVSTHRNKSITIRMHLPCDRRKLKYRLHCSPTMVGWTTCWRFSSTPTAVFGSGGFFLLFQNRRIEFESYQSHVRISGTSMLGVRSWMCIISKSLNEMCWCTEYRESTDLSLNRDWKYIFFLSLIDRLRFESILKLLKKKYFIKWIRFICTEIVKRNEWFKLKIFSLRKNSTLIKTQHNWTHYNFQYKLLFSIESNEIHK